MVAQILRDVSPDLYYFNISELLDKNKSEEAKTAEALDSVPYYAKFILIAAFCCSFNRRITDLRFFDMVGFVFCVHVSINLELFRDVKERSGLQRTILMRINSMKLGLKLLR